MCPFIARLAADFLSSFASPHDRYNWKSNDGCRAIGPGYKQSPGRRSSIGKIAGMCENPHVDMNRPAVAELMADSAALARRVNALCEDICEVIPQEIPQLNGDAAVLPTPPRILAIQQPRSQATSNRPIGLRCWPNMPSPDSLVDQGLDESEDLMKSIEPGLAAAVSTADRSGSAGGWAPFQMLDEPTVGAAGIRIDQRAAPRGQAGSLDRRYPAPAVRGARSPSGVLLDARTVCWSGGLPPRDLSRDATGLSAEETPILSLPAGDGDGADGPRVLPSRGCSARPGYSTPRGARGSAADAQASAGPDGGRPADVGLVRLPGGICGHLGWPGSRAQDHRGWHPAAA